MFNLRNSFVLGLFCGAAVAQANGGFDESCDTDSIHLSYSGAYYLSANCLNGRGGSTVTTIRLGLCIANGGGQLFSQKE